MICLFAVRVFTKVDLGPTNRRVTSLQLTVKILIYNQLFFLFNHMKNASSVLRVFILILFFFLNKYKSLFKIYSKKHVSIFLS